MINSPEPHRQELTEITSSTLDGVDCFMLCHETAIGSNGTAAVTALAKGIAEAENVFDHE
jgi:pyruvate kinase|tara:strand:- start:551 stop:730 length:180 start_codon:yes stop_codon:yes gene_type:complete